MDTVQLFSDFCKRYPVECTIDRVFNAPSRIEFYHKPTGDRYSTVVHDDSYLGIGNLLHKVCELFDLKEDKTMSELPRNYFGIGATDYHRMFKPKTEKEKMLDKIKKVVFADPATIVYWADGTKTVVKVEGEAFDPEKGLAMAFAKKLFGNKGNYYEVFKTWLPEDYSVASRIITSELKMTGDGTVSATVRVEEKGNEPLEFEPYEPKNPTYLTPGQLAARTGLTADTIREQCRAGLHPGAVKLNGKWMIPYEER